MNNSNITNLLSRNPRYQQQYAQTASRYLVPKEASIEAEVRRQTQQLQQEDKIHNAHSYWYNPCKDPREVTKDPATGNKPKCQSIYFGESYDRTRPSWEIQAVDYRKYSDYLKSEDASTDRQATRFDNLVGVFGPEIENDAYSYLKAVEADVMTSSDFSNMQLLTTFIDILDVQQKMFVLASAVTTKATNVLNLQTALYDRFQITEEIGELEAPESRKGKFETQTFKLKKAGGAIAWSDEFMMQNWVIDPYSYISQNMSSDIVRVKSKKIASALATLTAATTGSGSTTSLAAFAASSDHANVRALLLFADIRAEMTAATNPTLPDTIATNDKTYNYYISNPDISPVYSGNAPNLTGTVAGTAPAPGLPGVTWYVDNSLTAGTIYYYNKNAVWMIQGPSRTSNYRDEFPGQSGVLFRDWHAATAYQATWGRYITGATT